MTSASGPHPLTWVALGVGVLGLGVGGAVCAPRAADLIGALDAHQGAPSGGEEPPPAARRPPP